MHRSTVHHLWGWGWIEYLKTNGLGEEDVTEMLTLQYIVSQEELPPSELYSTTYITNYTINEDGEEMKS